MALNGFKFLKYIQLVPNSSAVTTALGELEVLSASSKITFHNGSSASPVVTESHTATLTNKSIDSDLNTITNIKNADIKVGAAIDRAKLASGTANRVIINNGSGVLSELLLSSAQIILGNGSNIPTATSISGAITIDNLGVTSLGTGIITDANIAIGANIARSKLASGTANAIVVNDASGVMSNLSLTSGQLIIANASNIPTAVTISGDATIDNSGNLQIASGAIVNADINASAAITRTKLASGTADSIIINNSSGVISELAPGTSGYFLKTQGVGLPPVWASVASISQKLRNYVVGSATDVLNGLADYSSIASAITAASNNESIFILPSYNSTENITINKRLFIDGAGYGSFVNGTITVTNAGASCRVENLRVAQDVTIQSGANSVYFDIILASGKTFNIDSTVQGEYILAQVL